MNHHSNFLWIAGCTIVTLSMPITSGQEVKAGVASAQVEKAPPSANQPGSVEFELISLFHKQFASPEAKQMALREWHEKNGAALKAEIDVRRVAERPSREVFQKDAYKRFEVLLGNQIRAGKLGKLEAEFIRLTRVLFKSHEQRDAAFAQWFGEKGAELDAERENRRSIEVSHRATLQAGERELRLARILQAQQNGKIGPREAELMQLHNNLGNNSGDGPEQIRKWIATYGGELEAEINARRQGMSNKPTLLNSPENPATH